MRLQTMSDDCSPAQNEITTSAQNNVPNNIKLSADINTSLSSPCSEAKLTLTEPSPTDFSNLYGQHTDDNGSNNSIQNINIQDDINFSNLLSSSTSKEDDEFSEFKNCSLESNNCGEFTDFTDFTSFNKSDTNFGNFANFECNNDLVNADSAHLFNGQINDDPICDDEFADFESAPNDSTLNQQEFTPTISNIQSTYSIDQRDYNKIFKDTFQSSNKSSEELENTISSNIFDHCSNNSQLLWSNLQKIDLKSNYYTDKWKNSQTFKHLLQALKIDKRNMINSEILPVYVASLGQILQPAFRPNSTETVDKSSSSESANKRAESKDILCDFQPVFTLNQDLDFFESKYSGNTCDKTNNVKDDLISEFENIMLDNCHNGNNDDTKNKKQSPISQSSSVKDLKEMLKNPITQSNNEQVLSAEALQILSELPNLSFIRAKVLMFPINDK